MATLVSVAEYRAWSGASSATIPDSVIADALDEAEAGMLADLGTVLASIQETPDAAALATGEELRRASRLLARRNSPEAVAGFGELALVVPSRDPDSARTLAAIRAVLLLPEAVS